MIAAWCIPEASLQALSLERSLDIKKSALARLAELAKPAANPDTSPEQLVVIASSAKGTAKVALAANPATPEHLIRAFAAEAHEATDKALLKNPRLPADVSQVVYARVFESMGPMQRLALLEHERTPWSIRKLAAQNAWLARWPRTQDWHRDAFNFVFAPDADADPHDVLHIPNGMEATYAASTLRSARLLGLAHPRTPLELLIKRSNSVDWVERLAIARNTSLPPNLVSKLKKDPHRLVAAQALATEAAKGTIKANQEQLLAETLAPVDWGKVVEALLREIRDKHVRPWEWFQTLWWPHLNLEFRMGLKAGPLYEKQTPYWLDQDLEEFFLDSPFSRERLAGAKWALLTAWLRKSALDLDPSGATRISEPLAPMERDESIMILEWAKDKDPNLRLRAIAHPQVSMDVLHLLATDKNQDVRLLAEVATLGRGDQVIPNRPARVSEIAGKVLAASDRCKEAVSGLPSSPAEILEALASHKPSDDVVGALARNPGAPASVLISVIRTAHARGATWKMTEALKNPSVSPAVIETLLKSKAAGIRAAIAMAEKVPLVIVRDLEKDADPEVRAALASRKDLPLDLQTVLSSDPDPKVRIALLRSGELPIALRESLARDLDPIVRSHALEPGGFAPSFYTELVGAGERCLSPNCIAEIEDEATLMTLAMSGEEFVDRSLYGGVTRTSAQGAILSRRQVPPSVLEALAMTPSHRRQIAGRNDVPSTLLSEFLEDPDERVVTAALENPRVEEGQMRRALAQRQSEARGRSVVHNPNSPHDLIEAAFKEFGGSKLGVNYWVENVSWLALKLSGASRHHQTQGFLRQERDRALSAKASPEELRRLCATGFWVIRKAVAANAVLPPEERASILRQLWAEVEAALFGDAPEAINSDQVSEEEVVAALQRLDLMPPAGDKRAIAAAAKSPELLRRLAAILSPGVQPSILKLLLEDEADCVKALAAEKLRALDSSA